VNKRKAGPSKAKASTLSAADRTATEALARRLYTDPVFRVEKMIRINDKQGNKIPFRPWTHQAKNLRNRSRINITVKPRQVGSSTAALGDKLALVRLYENRECLILHYDNKVAPVFFAKVRDIDKNLDVEWAGEKLVDTATAIHYADTNSIIRIDTAGQSESVADRKGRSTTVYWLIITEAAYIPHLAKIIQGATASVPEGGEIDIESTSRGPRGAYHALVMKVKSLGVSIDVNVWRYEDMTLKFTSYLEHIEYRVRLDPGEKLELDAEEVRIQGCGRQWRIPETEILESIKFRRRKIASFIKDPDQKTSLTPEIQFKREYPATLEDAFTDSGSNYFDFERLTAIKALVQSEKLVMHQFGILRRHGQAPELVAPSPTNRVTIWTGPKFVGLPVDGYLNRYLVFGDVGEGKPDSDPDAVYVFDRLRYCIVAAAYGRMGPELTAYTMMNLGDLYFTAWIAWDCTGIGKELRPHFLREKYPKLWSSKEIEDVLQDSRWIGLQWGRTNRHEALELLRTMWQNQEMTIPDLEAYEEANQFGYDEGEEFPRAAAGFMDDRIMSLAGLVFVNQYIPKLTKSAPMKPFDKKKPLLEQLRRHAPEARPGLTLLDE
jgi:hypothetical protein